jgi:hypothetical protein
VSAATDLLDRLLEDYEMMERSKSPDEIVRLLNGGMFGGLSVVDIQPASDDAFRIVVTVQDGSPHVIIASVSQCSFMLSIITPDAGEPRKRVIFGFREGRT